MACFKKGQSIADFQNFVKQIYSLPDDLHFSLLDLLIHEQRFAMRALKGIRKNNPQKIKLNMVIAFSFLMAIGNRLHIDIEQVVWQRFPMLCSYCGEKPCICKKIKLEKRHKVHINNALRPGTLSGFQKMFEEIYPSSSRTLTDAGIHLAEEIGEVTEAVQNFLGQHQKKLMQEIVLELADCVSCIFGVANSSQFDLAQELARLFSNNCHVCHKAPCVCNFHSVATIKT